MSTNVQQTVGFLDLPAEIRLQIYDLLCPHDVRVDEWYEPSEEEASDELLYAGINANKSGPSDGPSVRFGGPRSDRPAQQAAFSLMRTSKTIYRELSHEFYQRLRFQAFTGTLGCLFTRQLPTLTTRFIQDFTITKNFHNPAHSSYSFRNPNDKPVEQMKWIQILLNNLPNLRRLTFNDVPFSMTAQHTSEPTWEPQNLLVLSQIPKMHQNLPRAFFACYESSQFESHKNFIGYPDDAAGPPDSPIDLHKLWFPAIGYDDDDDDDDDDGDDGDDNDPDDDGDALSSWPSLPSYSFGLRDQLHFMGKRYVVKDLLRRGKARVMDFAYKRRRRDRYSSFSSFDSATEDDADGDATTTTISSDDGEASDATDLEVNSDGGDNSANDNDVNEPPRPRKAKTIKQPRDYKDGGYTTLVFCADEPKNPAFQEVDFPGRWQTLFDAVPPKAEEPAP